MLEMDRSGGLQMTDLGWGKCARNKAICCQKSRSLGASDQPNKYICLFIFSCPMFKESTPSAMLIFKGGPPFINTYKIYIAKLT